MAQTAEAITVNKVVILLGVFALIGALFYGVLAMALMMKTSDPYYDYGRYGLVAFGIICIIAGIKLKG